MFCIEALMLTFFVQIFVFIERNNFNAYVMLRKKRHLP